MMTTSVGSAGGGDDAGHVTGTNGVAELRLPSHVASSLHVHSLHPAAEARVRRPGVSLQSVGSIPNPNLTQCPFTLEPFTGALRPGSTEDHMGQRRLSPYSWTRRVMREACMT